MCIRDRSDGPNGVRGDSSTPQTSACFPSPILLGATWNEKLIKKIGLATGEEALYKDVDVLLAPTINLHRHPLGGRHFECYSEDPVLTSKIACSYVSGVQSKGVAACLKHFAGNDTEFERHLVSSNIDEKTLRELYLYPFEMGIKKAKAKLVGFACIIDRSNKKNLKIKNKPLISQLKVEADTFHRKKLPLSLKKIPVTSPGSRRV